MASTQASRRLSLPQCGAFLVKHLVPQQNDTGTSTTARVREQAHCIATAFKFLDTRPDSTLSTAQRLRLANASTVNRVSWTTITAAVAIVMSDDSQPSNNPDESSGVRPWLAFTALIAGTAGIFYSKRETRSATKDLETARQFEAKREEVIRSLRTLDLAAKALIALPTIPPDLITDWQKQMTTLAEALSSLNITEEDADDPTLTDALSNLTLSQRPEQLGDGDKPLASSSASGGPLEGSNSEHDVAESLFSSAVGAQPLQRAGEEDPRATFARQDSDSNLDSSLFDNTD